MLKIIYLISLCFSFLLSQNLNYAVSDRHAFTLPKGKLQIESSYLKVNDTIDILNIRDSQGDTPLGDMDGYDIALRYGLRDDDSIFISYNWWRLEYSGTLLKNKKIDIFNRYNIVTNRYGVLNSLSIDVGYTKDSADTTLYSNLNSNSYYSRILIAKKISSNALLDLYLGYKKIDIKGNLSLTSLDRDEDNINMGFVYTLQSSEYIYEFNYEYNRLFRESSVSHIDYNHIIDASISKVVNSNLLLYVGWRVMSQQFNTDIPYLYNSSTKDEFDKKYGFAKVGIVYSFRGL